MKKSIVLFCLFQLNLLNLLSLKSLSEIVEVEKDKSKNQEGEEDTLLKEEDEDMISKNEQNVIVDPEIFTKIGDDHFTTYLCEKNNFLLQKQIIIGGIELAKQKGSLPWIVQCCNGVKDANIVGYFDQYEGLVSKSLVKNLEVDNKEVECVKEEAMPNWNFDFVCGGTRFKLGFCIFKGDDGILNAVLKGKPIKDYNNTDNTKNFSQKSSE